MLSFIPEVGAFLAMFLSLPVILFDSRHETAIVTPLRERHTPIGFRGG